MGQMSLHYTFDELIDKKVLFQGVDCNLFKVNFTVFEAVEDPNDGYRSYLGSIQRQDESFDSNIHVLVTITHQEDDYNNFYLFTDMTGHVWLTFGTENTNDYYPCFIFRYTPKEEEEMKYTNNEQFDADRSSYDKEVIQLVMSLFAKYPDLSVDYRVAKLSRAIELITKKEGLEKQLKELNTTFLM